MKKKQLTMKLLLKKETLRNLSERDLRGAVGGGTAYCTSQYCEPTDPSVCNACPTLTCLSGGSCPTGVMCC